MEEMAESLDGFPGISTSFVPTNYPIDSHDINRQRREPVLAFLCVICPDPLCKSQSRQRRARSYAGQAGAMR